MGDELSYKYDIIIFIKKYYAIIKIKKRKNQDARIYGLRRSTRKTEKIIEVLKQKDDNV